MMPVTSRRPHLPALAMAPFILAGTAFFMALDGRLGASIGLDYEFDAARSTFALAHGDLETAFSHQPAMGFFSILLRAPFVAFAPKANLDAQYLLGVVPCMAIAIAVLMAVRQEVAARWPASRSLAALPWLWLASAPMTEALLYGRPEEPLGAALCVGAALAAIRGRGVVTGVLLGLAVATKQWGAFALLPILAAGLAADGRGSLAAAVRSRGKVALVAGAVALALALPYALGDTEQFLAINRQAASTVPQSMTPLSVWAAISPAVNTDDTAPLGGFAVRLHSPEYAGRLSRPLMALAILGATLLAARLRRNEDLLGLLALVFLARCAFDPFDNIYYHAPFLMALIAWETLRFGRLPGLSLVSAGVLGAIAVESHVLPYATTLPTVMYLLWAVPLAVAVTRLVLAPDDSQPAQADGAGRT